MNGMEAERISGMWDCLSKMGANVDYLKRLNLSDEAVLQLYSNVKRIVESHLSSVETVKA